MASKHEDELLGVIKSCFGEFRCSNCGRGWESSKAWRDYGQECTRCRLKIRAYRLLPLYFYYCAECEYMWRHKWVEEGVECRKCGETTEGCLEFQAFWTPRRLNENGSGVIDQAKAHQRDKCEKCILLGDGRLCYQSDYVNLKNPHISFQLSNGQTANLKPTEVKTYGQSASAPKPNAAEKLGKIEVTKPLTFEEKQKEQAIVNATKKQQKEARKQQMEIQERKRQDEERRQLDLEESQQRVAEELQQLKLEESRQREKKLRGQKETEKRLQQQKEAERQYQRRLEKRQLQEDEQRRAAEERELQVRETEQRRVAEERQIREAEQCRVAKERQNREVEQRRVAEERQNREAEQRRVAQERQNREAEQRRVAQERQNREAEQGRRREYYHPADGNENEGGVLAVVGAVALVGLGILRFFLRG